MRSHAKAPSAGSTQRKGLLPAALIALLALVMLPGSAPAAESLALKYTFGPDGTSGTDFGNAAQSAVDQGTGALYVIDRSAGSLYRFDADGNPLPFTGSAPYISDNAITGLAFTEVAQVAVDSQSHVFYVTSGNAVQAFQADGEEAEFTAGPGAGTNEIGGFSALFGLAVDSNGAIYASDFLEWDVKIYAPSGEPLTEAANLVTGPTNLAVDSEGELYVQAFGINKFTPSEFPVTSETTYGQSQQIASETPNALAVDPATDDLYAVHSSPPRVVRYDEDGNEVDTFAGPGEEGELGSGARGIAVGNERIYVSNVTQVEVFGTPPPAPPVVLTTSASDVSASSARLRAEINPRGLETTYRFEYGLGDCAANPCTSVPGSGPLSPGFLKVGVSRQITGLQPGTTYHYRVVAENSEGVTEGPDRTLTTQVGGLSFELPDRRAWEMVSPPNKHGGALVQRHIGIVQAAEDGEGIAYLSAGSIEPDPEGNRALELSTVLSRRGADGWSSKDITAPHTEATPVEHNSEYQLFAPDLSAALLEARDDTPLSPQASERTPYLRENTDPATYTPLITGKEGFANVPPGTEFGGDNPLNIMGANRALTDVVFRSSVALAVGAQPDGLYHWSAGQIQLVSQLPPGEGGAPVPGRLGSDRGSVRNAVSADGSRIFWAAGGDYDAAGIGMTALHLRDTLAEESVRLDVVQSGASGAGEFRPAFQGASADGTVVFFTDSRDLTEDSSSSGRDLYRCEIPAGASLDGCATLTNISAPLAGSGESAMVKDISPALSEDGARIYFVAEAVLDTAPNEEGNVAQPEEPNLYLWEEGAGVRFIAVLSPGDAANWGVSGFPLGRVAYLSATGSPSGRYFAFMSERSLTGYDNRDAQSEEPTEQAFRYDAESDELVCISCNPSGARPQGMQMPDGNNKVDRSSVWVDRWVAAVLPETNSEGFGETLYRPRSVLENGRVFFNAIDALVPADSNGEWDVYQYESAGVGDCTLSANGASVSRSGEGCVSLLSSGTAEEEAAFLDASASGEDVFFLTPAKLSVTDEDNAYDVYDARVDGVPATLEPNTECLGEACQPAAIAPNDPTPASARFRGQGNPKPNARKRCAKGKRLVRRKGRSRCVARKHRRQGQAGMKRRASR